MPINNQPRTVIQSFLRSPNNPATLPPNTGATRDRKGINVTTGTSTESEKSISQFITHIARSDNHLWQALTSLQNQANGLVQDTSQWTSWIPHITDDLNVVLPVSNDAAYFMTFGPLLFIELHMDVTVSQEASQILISLPVDTGTIVLKTCAAYLLTGSNVNAVTAVEIASNVAVITIDTIAEGTTCTLMMGGAIAIL